MSAEEFDTWCFKNGIRISKSLKEKLDANCLASVRVLTALNKMGVDALKQVKADMKLNLIENAIFDAIVNVLSGSEGSSSTVPTGQKSQGKITSVVPEILSISDNKNGAVNIEWKLVQKPLNVNDSANRLKLEWAADEKALDFDYTNDQIIELNRIDLNVVHRSNVLVKDINANKFRLKWRNLSAVKTLKLASDRWDANNKGSKIKIDGNVIGLTAGGWNSVYGQVVCKPPYTYHWQFRIKTYATCMMFAVAKVSDGYKWKETYLGNQGMGYYRCGSTHFYNTFAGGKDLSGGNYGHERFAKNGDVLDMYLDLKNYTLSYKTGGKDVGFKFENLPRENYRMIVSLHNQPQQIELTAFDYN